MSDIDDLEEITSIRESEIGPCLDIRARGRKWSQTRPNRNHKRNAEIVALYRGGETLTSLSNDFGLSVSSIHRIIKKWSGA